MTQTSVGMSISSAESCPLVLQCCLLEMINICVTEHD